MKTLKKSELCRHSDLSKRDLQEADFCSSDLKHSMFFRSDLSSSDFGGCKLEYTDFFDSKLVNSTFWGADLRVANFSKADMRGACLGNTNLSWVRFDGADLRGVILPSPTMVLLANWGALSDKLTALAMAYDASCHPDPSKFDHWAETSECPYHEAKFQRACNFLEDPSCWDPKLKAPRAWDLMVGLIREKCANSDFH